MPRIDLDAMPQSNATGYPEPYAKVVEGRWYRRLAPASGLTQMGASHVVLKPGGWSSQRHWHTAVDELLVMLSGEARWKLLHRVAPLANAPASEPVRSAAP